eukprot:SAG31_NODE_3469_length_4238_cov_2.647741_7_plen_51_part_01
MSRILTKFRSILFKFILQACLPENWYFIFKLFISDIEYNLSIVDLSHAMHG